MRYIWTGPCIHSKCKAQAHGKKRRRSVSPITAASAFEPPSRVRILRNQPPANSSTHPPNRSAGAAAKASASRDLCSLGLTLLLTLDLPQTKPTTGTARSSRARRMAASGGVARGRLAEERKSWRKSHPHGFVAKPETLPDGTVNLMVWKCVIPGKEGTDWEGGYFPVTLHFTENYPSKPPTCKFPAKFFHVNVYDCGEVCLSILGDAWKPSITVRQIVIGIQDLLDNPNPASPAQDLSYDLFTKNMPEYRKRVRDQAKLYPSLV